MVTQLKLSTSDATRLLTKCIGSLPKHATLVVPPNSSAILDFARLLSSRISLTCVAIDSKTAKNATVRGLDVELAPHHVPKTIDSQTRYAAWHTVKKGHNTVLLPDTVQDNAIASLTTLTGRIDAVSHTAPGCEMLPRGALQFVRPLLDVGDEAGFPGVHTRPAVAHGSTRASCSAALEQSSSKVLLNAVVASSHWGYLVVSRGVLASAYSADELAVRDAISRILAHVSGSNTRARATSESVALLADELLRPRNGTLPELPKGRTLSGMIARRATGKFARGVAANANRRDVFADDLIIFTREPCNEGATLRSIRLNGNLACAPLTDSVYWDNRYVMFARSASEPVRVTDMDVLEAVLRPLPPPEKTTGDDHVDIVDASLYVRQLTRIDWARMTAATDRVRSYGIPFECIRALPAVFQKSPGSENEGAIVASPHLGLTTSNDLLFTGVCMPRFRALPERLCPGFLMKTDRTLSRTEEHNDARVG